MKTSPGTPKARKKKAETMPRPQPPLLPVYAFDAVFACSCIFFLILAAPQELTFLQSLSWVVSWLCLLFFSKNVVRKRLHVAAIVFLASFATALPWLLPASTDLQIYWILVWIAALLVIWPFRFLALGELASACIYGLGFWLGSFSLFEGSFDPRVLAIFADSASPMPEGLESLCGVLAWFSFLVLFAESFLKDISLYQRHKELQHYSLPVLVGNLSGFFHRKWQDSPLHRKWIIAFFLLYALGGIALLAVFL